MHLQTTAAKSSTSRVSKPNASRSSPLKKSRGSSSSAISRRQGLVDQEVARLDDLGPVRSFSGRVKVRDVMQCIQHINDTMFDEIPERRSGINSLRQVETRDFRIRLPPLASVAHVHALSKSPTAAEREIALLVARGVLRKIHIPGRGLGTSAIGEFLVSTDQWSALVQKDTSLPNALKERYTDILRRPYATTSIAGSSFTAGETATLIRSGLLTSASLFTRELPPSLTGPDNSMRGTLSSLAAAGSQYAAGSLGAVGGSNAVYDAGAMATGQSNSSAETFNLTVPSVGVYLRLLASAREHLIALLSRSKFGEAPADVLKERWDGGIQNSGHPSRSKGLELPLLPGRTRKWKQFHGLRYQWILEECLGTGAIECFDTGAVGLGVRLP